MNSAWVGVDPGVKVSLPPDVLRNLEVILCLFVTPLPSGIEVVGMVSLE